jgi:hypothetical protein
VSDAQNFQVGQFVSPLTSSTANALLQDADPALYQAIRFYQAVLSIHLGARFDAEVTKAGLTQYVGKISTLAVPFDPLPYLNQAGWQPPILALFTVGEKITDRTRAWYQVEADWKLQWILPPLTADQFNALYPILRAAGKVITDRTVLGYDPSYLSGSDFCQLGGIEQLDLGPVRYGSIQGLDTKLFFPTVEYEMTAFERRETTPLLVTLAGTDGTIQVTDENGLNPITVEQFQT